MAHVQNINSCISNGKKNTINIFRFQVILEIDIKQVNTKVNNGIYRVSGKITQAQSRR